jgi:hypothetical protein
VAPRVRSDHHVSLKVLTEAGKVVTLGSHEVPGKSRFGYRSDSTAVPHVMRVSPSGKSLAAYDGAENEVRVYDLGPTANFVSYRRLSVPELGGPVKQLRWLAGGSAVALMSNQEVAVVGLNGEYGESTVRVPLPLKRRDKIIGIRSNESGFYVHTSRSSFGHRPRGQRLYFVSTGAWAKPIELTPNDGTLEGLTTLDDSRLAMAIRKGFQTEFRIVSTKPNAVGRLLATQACPTKACHVKNWVPGGSHLAIALSDGTLMWGTAADKRVVVKPRPGTVGETHSFWTNPTQDLFLAADRRSVKVYSHDGELRWTWKSPAADIVTAHFSEDEKGVLVATENALILLEAGQEVQRLAALKTSPEKDAKGRDVHMFYDDVKPLGAGAVAWQEVRVFRTVTYPSGPSPGYRGRRGKRLRGILQAKSRLPLPAKTKQATLGILFAPNLEKQFAD